MCLLSPSDLFFVKYLFVFTEKEAQTVLVATELPHNASLLPVCRRANAINADSLIRGV